MRIEIWQDLTAEGRRAMLARPALANDEGLAARVAAIIERVRSEGDAALFDLTAKIDRVNLEGTIDLVGDSTGVFNEQWGSAELAQRSARADLAPDQALPADTRLWAALQHASGGVWGGCVYDSDAIIAKLTGAK